MGLFRLLFYFIIGYSIFRFLSAIFRPKRTQQSNYTQQRPKRKEGDVAVDSDPTSKKEKRISKDEGDYVDYEDV